MPVRIAFDVDGVVADFATAYRDVERRLFSAASTAAVEPPEVEAQLEEQADTPPPSSLGEQRRRRETIWKAIHETPDFWTALKPLDPAAIPRIHEMMLRKGWEVFFITQRPATAGQTVQRQTQQWLRDQGFDLPSVLVIGGSRGAAAAALRLTYHVDDTLQHCIDVSLDSRAKAILLASEPDGVAARSARNLGIGVARSIGHALDLLEQLPGDGSANRSLLERLSKMIGRT